MHVGKNGYCKGLFICSLCSCSFVRLNCCSRTHALYTFIGDIYEDLRLDAEDKKALRLTSKSGAKLVNEHVRNIKITFGSTPRLETLVRHIGSGKFPGLTSLEVSFCPMFSPNSIGLLQHAAKGLSRVEKLTITGWVQNSWKYFSRILYHMPGMEELVLKEIDESNEDDSNHLCTDYSDIADVDDDGLDYERSYCTMFHVLRPGLLACTNLRKLSIITEFSFSDLKQERTAVKVVLSCLAACPGLREFTWLETNHNGISSDELQSLAHVLPNLEVLHTNLLAP